MNAPEKIFLPDIQATPDRRDLAISQVGIKDLRVPLEIAVGGDTGTQHTIARATLTVGLAAAVKGTHMSRFIELMEAPRAALTPAGLLRLVDEMLLRLGADRGRIDLAFPYFVRKTAPVSGAVAAVDYDVRWVAERCAGRAPVLHLSVTAPVTSLCPCSKEISDYGAHNQRSLITIDVEVAAGAELGIEELIGLAERAASCEVFGLLKRTDEKWVTERAYDNPKFVEDLVRDIALALKADARIDAWKVISENFESIHNHSAYAEIVGRNGVA